jgi:hypothetical protein
MGLDYIWLRVDKASVDQIKVFDVLVGPFNFVPDFVDPPHEDKYYLT